MENNNDIITIEDIEKVVEQPRRPKITDPKEWALIRKIHFKPITAKQRTDANIDPYEVLDRMSVRRTNKNEAR